MASMNQIKSVSSGTIYDLNDYRSNMGINYVTYDYQTDSTISGLVNGIGTNVYSKSDGFYYYSGGWKNHSNGYCAHVSKVTYTSGGYKISGIVFEYADGNLYAFTNHNGTYKVSPAITQMV